MRALALPALVGLSACSSPPPPPAPAPPAAPAAFSVTAPTVLRDPWVFAGRDGWVLRTTTHTIRTTTAPPLADRLAPVAAAALDFQTTHLTPLPRPARALDAYVMANRPQWADLTLAIMGDDAPRFLRIDRGGFTARRTALLYDIGPHDTLALLAHEHWHLYTQAVFTRPLPAWLEEGLGTYFEGFVSDPTAPARLRFEPWANVERFDQLRDAEAAGLLIPLPDLLAGSPERALDGGTHSTLAYYAQVWALVHFLLEHDAGRYRPALEAVLADAARPGPRRRAAIGLDLFTERFDPDLARATRDYDAFVRRIVRIGGKDRIVRGLSPIP